MKNGGKRAGAGRKVGYRSPKTLERAKVMEAYRQRVLKYTDHLLNAQLTLARGQTYLYKIEKEVIKNKKGEVVKVTRKKPELVTAQWEIEAYLENRIKVGEEEDPEDTYYFLTTKDPDGRVINDMLDRTHGRPTQSVVTEDPEGNQIPIGAINVVPINDPTNKSS